MPESRTRLVALLFVALLTLTVGSGIALANGGSPAGGGSDPGGGDVLPVEPDGGIGDTPDVLPVEPDGGIGDTPEDPVTGSPVDPTPTEPGDGALHVEPDDRITDGRPHAIDHIVVGADGRTVTIYWWGGVEDCYGLQEVVVTYDEAGRPIFTVLEGSQADLAPDTACIELALLKATTVTLERPLFTDGAA